VMGRKTHVAMTTQGRQGSTSGVEVFALPRPLPDTRRKRV
jgi:hypothetical protein